MKRSRKRRGGKKGWSVLLLLILAAFSGVGIYKAFHRENPGQVVVSQETLPERNPGLSLSDNSGLNPSAVPIGGPFNLIDQTGTPRTEKSFPGKHLIVYFGYTYCPDICPMALQSLSQVMEIVDPQGKKFQPLFITVDPERDTVESLALYAQNFHPTFVMLTGSPDAIQAAMKAYRVYANRVKKEGTTEDLIDHSSVVYVMNPEGQFLTHFNHTTAVEEMVGGMKMSINS